MGVNVEAVAEEIVELMLREVPRAAVVLLVQLLQAQLAAVAEEARLQVQPEALLAAVWQVGAATAE